MALVSLDSQQSTFPSVLEKTQQFVSGVSSVAKGYSNYVDSMVDGKMSEAFTKAAGMDVRETKMQVLT